MKIRQLLLSIIFSIFLPILGAEEKTDCLKCHTDKSLKSQKGHSVFVNIKTLKNSVHSGADCVDCHTQPADYEKIPHFSLYRKVDCSECHEDATNSFKNSFHDIAKLKGNIKAPNCISCHQERKDSHSIQSLNSKTAESACRACHTKESELYDTSVHAIAAKSSDAKTPGCISCHATHSKALPPSAGAVNLLCNQCHPNAMQSINEGIHLKVQQKIEGTISCASCHDVHATHKPHRDEKTLEACQNCHQGYKEKFIGSAHEKLIEKGEMSCLSCHRSHQVKDAKESENYGCGACHKKEEEAYRKSSHRMARLHGNTVAATCASCHSGHHILPAKNEQSPVHAKHIPETCGKCHGDTPVITADYVRLPISIPRYNESVHGEGWKTGKRTAVCTDCHGTHDLQGGASLTSSIHKQNLANTCGKCHEKEAKEYSASIHGRAVAHGLHDSPSCTDCHEEHLIRKHTDPRSPVNRANLSSMTCARCHENVEMAAKYGLPAEVIQSYEDSYHGWAVKRGAQSVAICTDCHNTHAIGNVLDPASSIHKSNVIKTCGKCHQNSNEKFAASYNHVIARGKKMIHDWVRLFYLWLIALVLGGMLVHNAIIYIYELRKHYIHQLSEASVRRLTRIEIIQHALLFITFFSLAFSGFALRSPDSWWVQALSSMGFNEEIRRMFHRIMACLMIATSVFHLVMILATHRGRLLLKAMMPKPIDDTKEAIHNVLFYLGFKKQKPEFGMFDYTHKAEYWALVWGTIIMSVTGFVLWFPEIATHYFPAWIVRVCETIHFYEAILAVFAIIIWHFFFVIFRPSIYPMSWIWVNGRMPLHEWKENHAKAEKEMQGNVDFLPPEKEHQNLF
ncbi:MAG: cytochrome b/b6 domain-containing protein [Candidatus Brocadiae bacterium]|nr:cytochrome b/b6 domain-containing protein [Candidatus Brocadiia bacterium]